MQSCLVRFRTLRSFLQTRNMTMEGSICEEVSMQDCGPFLDPFEYLNQHAWRKMAEYGSQEISWLTKAFEDRRKWGTWGVAVYPSCRSARVGVHRCRGVRPTSSGSRGFRPAQRPRYFVFIFFILLKLWLGVSRGSRGWINQLYECHRSLTAKNCVDVIEEGKVGRNLIFVQLSALVTLPELIHNLYFCCSALIFTWHWTAVHLNPLLSKAFTIFTYAASFHFVPSSIFWMLSWLYVLTDCPCLRCRPKLFCHTVCTWNTVIHRRTGSR